MTKDVPPFHVVAGNPARILRKIQTQMSDDSSESKQALPISNSIQE